MRQRPNGLWASPAVLEGVQRLRDSGRFLSLQAPNKRGNKWVLMIRGPEGLPRVKIQDPSLDHLIQICLGFVADLDRAETAKGRKQ